MSNLSPKCTDKRQPKLSPQESRVLEYLKCHELISPWVAWEVLGVTKLSTIISELRRIHGLDIAKIPAESVNRYGTPVRYMTYSLRHRN